MNLLTGTGLAYWSCSLQEDSVFAFCRSSGGPAAMNIRRSSDPGFSLYHWFRSLGDKSLQSVAGDVGFPWDEEPGRCPKSGILGCIEVCQKRCGPFVRKFWIRWKQENEQMS